ncbi:OmpA family protein [Shewanella sp. GXUN23E]|uniref:MotY family protein n=1 Tax=Shewanella sp. GXUN23E TaxID=3422498 RepID=UPI003D7DF470
MTFICQASAQPTRYQTPLEQVQWQFEGDIFHCRLSQDIAGFGSLALTLLPGSAPELSLNADWLSQAGTTVASTVGSSWAQDTVTDTRIPMHWQERRAIARGQQLNRFIEALEQGHSWQVDIEQHQQVAYQLTAAPVRVSAAVQAWRQCRRDLLPQPFEYVRQRAIQFASASADLSADAEQDLRAIAQYVRADAGVSGVMVDGHADSQGNRIANLVLSQERAQNVASRLIELGVNADKLQVFHHGTRQPIAADDSAAGRQLNRRVVVRLVRAAGTSQEAAR